MGFHRLFDVDTNESSRPRVETQDFNGPGLLVPCSFHMMLLRHSHPRILDMKRIGP
jgi:hypothetical protein